ncbi:MAG: hypothetical protein H8D45_09595 [Bacteroidetes bacterium]|nr:hypothetical protein [Bacteroidota bacterium]
MDRPSVYIPAKPYIKAFYVNKYGNEPVYFPKKDKAMSLLLELLMKPPDDFKQKAPDRDSHIEIAIPYYFNSFHFNANIINYLSKRSKTTFERRLRVRFWNTFEEDILERLRNGYIPSDAIAIFIEKHHLPDDETTEQTLRKEIYRNKKFFGVRPIRAYKYAKK